MNNQLSLKDYQGSRASDANSHKLKSFFKTNYGIDLSDDQIPEIQDSLFHLGRAISRYCQQKEEENVL